RSSSPRRAAATRESLVRIHAGWRRVVGDAAWRLLNKKILGVNGKKVLNSSLIVRYGRTTLSRPPHAAPEDRAAQRAHSVGARRVSLRPERLRPDQGRPLEGGGGGRERAHRHHPAGAPAPGL